MLRRHFMTKAGYKPNIIVKYYADKKIHLFNDENANKAIQNIKIFTPNGYKYEKSNIVLVNNNFDYGIGYWEIYSQIYKVNDIESLQYGKKLIALFCKNIDSAQFYQDDEYITYINMNINTLEDEDVYFICGRCESKNINKLILPSNLLHFYFENPFDKTNLQKIVIPPNVNINDNHIFRNKNNESIELIFTGNEVPKFSYHKNDVIKCPPNLVDKYREYYPNAIAANNILYIKKVIRDGETPIKFNDNRNVDNELYITENHTNDGCAEINIINYDDFKNNNSSVYINSDYIVDIIFPESIVELNANFIGENLTKLTIPKNVTSIDSYFFQRLLILEENLINLSSIDITTMRFYDRNIVKNGIEENGCVIGDYRYGGITYKNTIHGVRYALYKNIIIPDYVETIVDSAFYNANIEYVFISKNISTINPGIASNIFSYTNCIIEVSEENEKYDSRDNCNAVIETATNALIAGNSLTNIPDSVEIIDSHALYRVNGLKTVNLKNVKTIKRWAFYDTYIDTLILNKTITSIEEAFDKPDNVIYNGTMEEWGNVYTYHAFRNGTIIHCLDGDITYNYQ